MSLLKRGDEALHYCDNSHRWPCPDPDADQEAWSDRVRAHVEQHRSQPERGYTISRRAGPPMLRVARPHRKPGAGRPAQ